MTKKERRITIRLNGEPKALRDSLSLLALLDLLGIQKERVVVEHNMKIVSRQDLEKSFLKQNDEVEIVHFVGGGAPKALVIVESPAKCKTINKYLGSDYEVVASMGHVIDLPRSKMGIDVDNNFEPQYIVVKERKKTLADLKKKAKGKDEIYLACDPDREGEAISWHLKNQLGKGKKVWRVVFNEITKDAVQEAFKHPSEIDVNLVSAQQARRVLDRLVGYSLSPLLWQKVSRGLSAGRVQSVALRMIVDREKEIRAFKPEEYWSVEAQLKKKSGDETAFEAKLEKIKEEKADIKNEFIAKDLVEKIETQTFCVREIKRQSKKRNPYPPFTTSKLQQAAYNLLRFPASKTMKVAQTLYEGVDIGESGTVGLITYMRTDSVKISESALKETRQYITKRYGNDYLPEKPNYYKAKKEAQGAHEAIRPTSIHKEPKSLEAYLSPDQYKLYSLIWNQALSSQMKPAVVLQEAADIEAGDALFRASGSRVEFMGFLAVTGHAEEKDNPLPPLEPKEILDLLDLKANQHFTKPPPRFTDASLVKALEEKGIGRPSTYAPTLSTLTDREYIRRDEGALAPTELGILVVDLLVEYFSKVMDYEFTATMEEGLDLVEEGQSGWVEVIQKFYDIFKKEVEVAKSQMQTVRKTAEATKEICEKCGKPMVIKWGRKGRFMSCSGWPECKNAKSIATGTACPECHKGQLVARRAKTGRGRTFYGCTRFPDCRFITRRLPKPNESAPRLSAEIPPSNSEGSAGPAV